MNRIRLIGIAVAGLVTGLSLLQALAGDAATDEFPILLGDIPHYGDEATAQAACKPDGVVWADRRTGFYYPKFFSDYGTTAHGTYTCHKLAVKADYWSLAPAEEGGHKGRSFPQFFCGACF